MTASRSRQHKVREYQLPLSLVVERGIRSTQLPFQSSQWTTDKVVWNREQISYSSGQDPVGGVKVEMTTLPIILISHMDPSVAAAEPAAAFDYGAVDDFQAAAAAAAAARECRAVYAAAFLAAAAAARDTL